MDLHAVSLCLVIFLRFSTDNSLGFVTLSPFEAAQVCSGQQLELRCATNETFIVWSFDPPLANDRGASILQDWFISSTDMSQQLQNLTVNSTSFNIMRTSTQHASPLVSTLTIINSSSALNATTFICTKIINNQHAMSALTTILVVEVTHTDNLSPPEVNTRPMFEMNGVSVTLEWMPEEGVSYNVVVDHVVDLRFIQRTIVNLTVFYNTPTNVTITATSCGQNSETAITSVELAYGRCDDPLLSIADNSVMSVRYPNLALNGTMVTFSCPAGRILNGPNSAMCTHTGQWEPNPRAVNCSENRDTPSSTIPNVPVVDDVPSTNSKQILGISLGILIPGVAVGTLVAVVVIVIIFIRMRKKGHGAVHAQEPRYMRTQRSNQLSGNNHQDEKSSDTLVYADIGPSSFKHQVQLLPRDFNLDNPVEYAKLDHTQSPVATTMESQVDDNIFDVNLDILLIQLRPQVTSKWYEFGKTVGIEKKVLDNCASICAPEECIVEILDHWLRNHVGQVTWRKVAKALKSIGLEKLALEIEDVYRTGKLPVEINMNEVPKDLVFTTDSEVPPPIPPKAMDLSNNGILDSNPPKPSLRKTVPPIPPKGARIMPLLHMNNNLDGPPADIPDIPPRPPKT